MQTGYSAVWREDLPRRVAVWHCEACIGTACEMATESGAVPQACPCSLSPEWRKGR